MIRNFTPLLLSLFLSINLLAQDYPPPSGVFCSCPPTLSQGSSSVVPNIASKDFVQGILVRIPWFDMAPAKGQYDFSLLDQQIALAESYNKKISFGVGCGPATPDWVYAEGAQYMSANSPLGSTDTIPLAWDSVFTANWTAFIDTLGKRYHDDTTIVLVYITTATANGFEMQLPRNTTPDLATLGYTDSLMTDAWKQSMDAFAAAFPNHYLTNDYHPVNSSNAVADSVYAYAQSTIGWRYGAAAWWWSQNNTTVYPDQYTQLLHSAANDTFAVVQVARNHTNDSAALGPGGLPAALELAQTDGICYWEVWSNDLQNPALDSVLATFACLPEDIGTAVTEPHDQPVFRIWPNPSSGSFSIESTEAWQQVSLYNLQGQRVWSSLNTGQPVYQTGQLDHGVYLVGITTETGAVSYPGKLVIEW